MYVFMYCFISADYSIFLTESQEVFYDPRNLISPAERGVTLPGSHSLNGKGVGGAILDIYTYWIQSQLHAYPLYTITCCIHVHTVYIIMLYRITWCIHPHDVHNHMIRDTACIDFIYWMCVIDSDPLYVLYTCT